MKARKRLWTARQEFAARRLLRLGLPVLSLWFALAGPMLFAAQNGAVTLFSTGFEALEGYDGDYTLAGQNLWIVEGSGGNGLVTNYFPGGGQQGFLGYHPPTNHESFVILRRPLNYVPPPRHPTVVRFAVDMGIVDSGNSAYDDFRWSVYNLSSNRLFSLSFDNTNLAIAYALDDGTGFVYTGRNFTNSTIYHLEIAMDFSKNRWTATLNDVSLLAAQPITTTGAELDLGDIDVVWAIADPKKPGDNYLLFDNYTVTAAYPPPPASLQFHAFVYLPQGQFFLGGTGESLRSVRLEASSDFRTWVPVATNVIAASGDLGFLDADAGKFSRRFYRARLLP
jgi:hypothetical protein